MPSLDPELIQKFLENKCSRTERDLIITFLTDHPGYASVLFPEEEWNNINAEKKLPGTLSSSMMKNIKAELFKKKQVTVHYYIKRISSIAAVFILMTAAALFFYKKQDRQTASIQKIFPHPASVRHDSTWIHCANTTGKPIAIVLPDKSRITLEPHSVLKYNKQFGLVKRDVWLAGEALFQIVHNEQKPFTVKTGSINITDLGTVFRVVSTNSHVNVHLYKGKVVVTACHLPGWKGDTYLSPGDELSYNSVTKMVAEAKFTGKKTTESPVNNQRDFDFNSASLKEVMDKLATSYHCKIAYSGKDIEDMNFTGTVTQKDSLTVILKLIATMNGLTVQLKGSNYIISKP